MSRTSVLLALLALSLPGSAFARSEGPGELAAALARLRAEVEQRFADVEEQKRARRAQLQGLEARQLELKLELQREQLRVKQLRKRLDAAKAKTAERSAAQAALVPAFEQSAATVRAVVAASLPFKRAERLGAIDEVVQQHKDGLLTPADAIARLWSVVSDEQRLTRENGLFRQVIALDGEERLVHVARLGTALMYAELGEDAYAQAVFDGAWGWRRVEGPEATAQVRGLFDALRKQIRVGFFELPVALPPGGAS